MPKHTNRLSKETSPYLRQHAHNPVDWYPWGQEALDRASEEDKPILLSIGYSACHWCHVMEHESFEDEDVAGYMNEHFVCIKVDREERPDLDKIYQTAHQLLTQRAGGWPLNVVITPAGQIPFFAGTYFPNQPRHGMPSFVEVLRRVSEHYRDHKERMAEHGETVQQAFMQIESGARSRGTIDGDVLDRAFDELMRQYDPVHGGFGSAPKFPHPTNLEVVLRRWARRQGDDEQHPQGLHAVRHTLQAMAHGGIYDQLGGGFCRYSVDDEWMIPHFEKMLYDNAQLLPMYVDAWLACDDQLFRDVAVETAEWVMREMQSPEGGYYSTLDADSEGEEGKFYVWTLDELKGTLNDQEWAAIEVHYGLRGRPNFEGKWHLNVRSPVATVAERLATSVDQTKVLLRSAKQKLFAARNGRVRPARDEKILTAWNGLMIKAMAHAGRFLEQDDFVKSAERALDFVRKTLWRDGRLLVTTKDGKTHLNAYLDDYVLLIDGVLALLQARWRDADLPFAIELAEFVLQHFKDDEYGGFYFTSDDHEKLLHRHKPTTDDATPSGNGVACLVLLRLGHIVGDHRYLQAAENTLAALSQSIANFPSAHGSLLLAIEEYLYPTQTIILRGEEPELSQAAHMCNSSYAPKRVVMTVPNQASSMPGILAQRTARSRMTAYVCEGHRCSAPIETLEGLQTHLAQSPAR